MYVGVIGLIPALATSTRPVRPAAAWTLSPAALLRPGRPRRPRLPYLPADRAASCVRAAALIAPAACGAVAVRLVALVLLVRCCRAIVLGSTRPALRGQAVSLRAARARAAAFGSGCPVPRTVLVPEWPCTPVDSCSWFSPVRS